MLSILIVINYKGEFIKNPTVLENDLSNSQNELEVKVIIIPKF